ncbi:peptidyl-tRNA hydrolase [Gloeophyllum trabeum ATCC 11539]|uniref:peptidyl-tRNA hydrolase n=1 Tax=Gloeophyllum trabeum (strain ATCC 11539 / FP-39264 / Madison 617) TaxID=670483 RepID=S7QAJ7_GLOTA|nr:peptidyl-tRNA hydrolase [Gloeophyllum trabeum ATCC 11539]EPQ56941.1 peptidyl-tRNA hydrolase [Gloeophyllum trabeum ATCC 11539]
MVVAGTRILVVGLGNTPLPGTRHSVGHLIIDALACKLGVRLSSERGGFTGTTTIDIGSTPVTITLFKPKALMNISGPPVSAALRKHALPPSSLIVIHDSLAHKPLTLSPKFGGSAGGHNGVRSIVAALGNDAGFHRLRVGIGRGGDAADYVLGRLEGRERAFWEGEGMERVWREIERVASGAVRG